MTKPTKQRLTYCAAIAGGDLEEGQPWPIAGYAWCAVCTADLTGRSAWFCGTPGRGRPSCRRWWLDNHQWAPARRACLKRDHYRCTVRGCLTPEEQCEANHIEPRRGKRLGVTSCRNHQSNLETLCVTHHRLVSEDQRKAALVG